jgi:site-specific DNA recombinase
MNGRLITAYQEDLLNLDELRCRIPELREQQQAVESELESLETTISNQSNYLRLLDGLSDFRERLREKADALDIGERQRILRLLTKEILLGKDTITIRHSIPIPCSAPDGGNPTVTELSKSPNGPGYLLRKGSRLAAACKHLLALSGPCVGAQV